MVTKFDWKQKTPAAHINVQVSPQRLQIRNWSRYHVVMRRIVASDGDGRKFLRRCQDSANRSGAKVNRHHTGGTGSAFLGHKASPIGDQEKSILPCEHLCNSLGNVFTKTETYEVRCRAGFSMKE